MVILAAFFRFVKKQTLIVKQFLSHILILFIINFELVDLFHDDCVLFTCHLQCKSEVGFVKYLFLRTCVVNAVFKMFYYLLMLHYQHSFQSCLKSSCNLFGNRRHCFTTALLFHSRPACVLLVTKDHIYDTRKFKVKGKIFVVRRL